MVQTIREAGKTPVERDALYRVIREYSRREHMDAPSSFGGVAVRPVVSAASS